MRLLTVTTESDEFIHCFEKSSTPLASMTVTVSKSRLASKQIILAPRIKPF